MKKFSKVIVLLLAMTMALSLAACSSSKSSDTEESSSDPIAVYTNAYFAPFEYYEGTDIVGVDVDIMNKVGEKLGREVEYTNVDFSSIIDNVSSGKLCDVGAAGITITESRQEQVDFSNPYFTSVQYVIYAAGTMGYDGTDGDVNYILWDDLAGKKIGVQMDTTGDIYVDGEINATEEDEDYGYDGVLYGTGAELVRYESAQLAVDAIGAGQVDVVVVDYLPASYIVEKNDGYQCAALYYNGGDEPNYPTEEQYAICVTKGQDELLEAINSVLDELGEDGINELVMKHMGLSD
jgi:polar amino acid transport system substrate-binding protein